MGEEQREPNLVSQGPGKLAFHATVVGQEPLEGVMWSDMH